MFSFYLEQLAARTSRRARSGEHKRGRTRHMNRLTKYIVAVALAQFSVSSGASFAAEYRPAPLSPRVAVKVAASPSITVFNTAIALDRGYFAAEGLDVELVQIADISAQLQSLVTDQVQF